MVSSVTTFKRGRKDIKSFLVTPKLVAALDRFQLSIRYCVYILVVETLDLSCDEFPINKSSIQCIRIHSRKDKAKAIKLDFQDNLPETVTVHWDGKLLPRVDVRSSKEEPKRIYTHIRDTLMCRLCNKCGIYYIKKRAELETFERVS